jgi:site-specific DNA recombinase
MVNPEGASKPFRRTAVDWYYKPILGHPEGNMTRVALYTRVSTDDQAKEGFSLEGQLDRLRHFARAQGWETAGEYVDDGHSGRTIRRPAYGKLMAEKSKWDTLLVLKMDRIHRNSRNFMAMMDDLRKEGKEFASVMESLDTSTAMGRFVMDIIQRIAQLESEKTGELVKMGIEDKERTTNRTHGSPVFGMMTVNKERQVDPLRAPVVLEMRNAVMAGTIPRGVTYMLNKRGIRAARGGRWSEDQVVKLLSNPELAGVRHHGKHPRAFTHKGIFTPEEFIALHHQLNRLVPASIRRRSSERVRVFQVFMRCLKEAGWKQNEE